MRFIDLKFLLIHTLNLFEGNRKLIMPKYPNNLAFPHWLHKLTLFFLQTSRRFRLFRVDLGPTWTFHDYFYLSKFSTLKGIRYGLVCQFFSLFSYSIFLVFSQCSYFQSAGSNQCEYNILNSFLTSLMSTNFFKSPWN